MTPNIHQVVIKAIFVKFLFDVQFFQLSEALETLYPLLCFFVLFYWDVDKHCTEMKFSITDFCSKCAQFPADLVTFAEEIRNGKLNFLCSEMNE